MALEMSLREFEDMNLYSNKSMERIISSIVNESSNAALVNMYEDSVILLDHENGSFYTADYHFDPKTLTLVLENYEEIFLVKEESGFKDSIKNFFEDEDASIDDLTESYKENVIEQEEFINELINETLAVKNFEDIIDYSQLAEANDDLSIKNEDFFKAYQERLETHPINEVKFFNFKDKVVVSLLENEKVKLINSNIIDKAADLWKRAEFKNSFNEAASLFIEDVEAGKDKFLKLFEEFPQVFFLDNADRKAMFGKAIISNNDLRESLDDLLKGMDILFEDEDIDSIRESYITELEGEGDSVGAHGLADKNSPAAKAKALKAEKLKAEKLKAEKLKAGKIKAAVDTADEEPDPETDNGDETADEPAKELAPEDIKKISDELKKLAEKMEDEKLKEKMDGIIAKLDGSVEEGTRPDLVKEAVYLLSI